MKQTMVTNVCITQVRVILVVATCMGYIDLEITIGLH